MTRLNMVSDGIGPCFELPDVPCLSVVPLFAAAFTKNRIDRPIVSGEWPVIRLPKRKAYVPMFYVDAATHADILPDDGRSPPRRYERHTICLVDLTSAPAIELHGDLDGLAFVFPKALLGEVSEPTDEIVAVVGITPVEFDAVFRSQARLSPEIWLTHARTRCVMTKLRQIWRPVGEVARASGFRAMEQFAKIFHDDIGMTPEEWRGGGMIRWAR